ncbi:MAG: hypothetical protein PWR24_1622 [Desulfonauticus sp.]|jgi:putative iron-only hydrogenase system regulator|nr:hypothetical protein [Desulfonauticus sp.]
MKQKVGIIGIIISKKGKKVSLINSILSEHAEIILGRMGLHFKQKDLGVIALIVEGDTDRIGSLAGKLGHLKGVSVKSILITEKEQNFEQ